MTVCNNVSMENVIKRFKSVKLLNVKLIYLSLAVVGILIYFNITILTDSLTLTLIVSSPSNQSLSINIKSRISKLFVSINQSFHVYLMLNICQIVFWLFDAKTCQSLCTNISIELNKHTGT